MSEFHLISLEEAFDFTHRRPGLLLGPGVTRAPGDLASLVRVACHRASVETSVQPNATDEDIRIALDQIDSQFPDKAQAIRKDVRDGLQSLKAPLDLGHLVKVSWSACISASEDLLFEGALRTYLDGLPSSRTATVIDHPSVEPPDRTIPVYKLMGNVSVSDEDRRVILSQSEFLFRRQQWTDLVRTLPDHIREAPLFILGASSSHDVIRDVLGLLLSMRHPRVSRLVFLKDDSALKDSTILQLCKKFTTHLVDGSLRDVCNKIAEEKKFAKNTLFGSALSSNDGEKKLAQDFSSIVAFVPKASHTQLPITASNLPLLRDSLFRPNTIDWDPYLAELDFRRRATDPIVEKVRRMLDSGVPAKPSYLVIHGEAGVGKTTTLKRVAIELATSEIQVVWCRRAPGSSWIRQFRDLAKRLGDAQKSKAGSATKLVVICDDPWALRLDSTELVACFDGLPMHIVFIFSRRNSDLASSEAKFGSLNQLTSEEYEFPFDLNSEEFEQLSHMLVRLGAAKNLAEAKSTMAQRPSENADDVLCSLWYLIPETRGQLAESLQDEYSRLGSLADKIGQFANAAAASASSAKRAYELVTVGSNLGLGIPVEVIVQALQLDYEAWTEIASEGRPLWGLLYSAESADGYTITYHTRNHVVTRVLLSLVNGGVGHAGEIRVLKDLLKACHVGSLVYRNFAVEILVKARNKLKIFLTYEQGIELYDLARAALPHEDRVIEHHRGIWIQDVGHKHKEAYNQFEKALLSPVYPGADRDAPTEYIHTSMAASILKLIQDEKQEYTTGAELIRTHLRQAANPRFFNPHTSHVAAGLLFDMSKLGQVSGSSGKSFEFVVEALQEIEKAMQSIGARGRHSLKYLKSIGVLSDLQRKILSSIPDSLELKRLASALFEEKQNQVGFEVVARRLLAEASQTSKGKDFNEINDYLNGCMQLIEDSNLDPSTELLVARVDLMIRWKVHGFKPVPWEEFEADLQDILAKTNYQDDLMKRFYLAVAQFHLGKLTDGHSTFAFIDRAKATALRPTDVRAYLLDQHGNPRRIQGMVKKSSVKEYFDCPELNDAFPIRGYYSGVGLGATTHAYVGFSLIGPTALFSKPDPQNFLLS